MGIHLSREGAGKPPLYHLTEETFKIIAPAREQLAKQTGVELDLFGDVRLSAPHAALFLALLQSVPDVPAELKQTLETAVKEDFALLALGD
ncbi:hypothetical protein MKQ68_01580 [Chitinophaga horti]|uniref:Uncharacterized protein n=1 Tax=Chitinophaga horti TaxID=2920382 RepID=A0ABY6J2A6_9BACT|nr:hypothetical protein [Chitinophaga horti]UYQ93785.1 hypothetical protein MKQ68_01580 [Chitinophaga horti]